MKKSDVLILGWMIGIFAPLILGQTMGSQTHYQKSIPSPVIQWKEDGKVLRETYSHQLIWVDIPKNLSIQKYCEYVPISTSTKQENKNSVLVEDRFFRVTQRFSFFPDKSDASIQILLCPKDAQKE